MQRACEVCEACAEVFVRAVHTPRVYYAHAWEGQPEVLVHARGVECQEVPGGASVKKVPGGSGPHRTRGGPNAVALRQGAETSQITCHLLRALGAYGHRHERRVTRCELQHAGGAGRPNVLRHLQERLGRSRGEALGGSRLRAACGRVASAAGLAPSRACRPIGTWSKTPTWLMSRPQAG